MAPADQREVQPRRQALECPQRLGDGVARLGVTRHHQQEGVRAQAGGGPDVPVGRARSSRASAKLRITTGLRPKRALEQPGDALADGRDAAAAATQRRSCRSNSALSARALWSASISCPASQ